MFAPYCTRKEAENIVVTYVSHTFGIDLKEIDPIENRHRYYYMMKAKDGVFKMIYGEWSENGMFFNDIGEIRINMLTREMPFDYKKEYKEFYMPKNKPEIVHVLEMNFIAVRGSGDTSAHTN